MVVPTVVFGLFAIAALLWGAESRPGFDEKPVLDDRPNWFPIPGSGHRAPVRAAVVKPAANGKAAPARAPSSVRPRPEAARGAPSVRPRPAAARAASSVGQRPASATSAATNPSGV